MAEKTAFPQSLYAFGEGEESALANQRYQDAYNQLIAAVEKRSQPQFFDPTLLAISQAFLGPTKTGSFGEAAGIAAGNVAKAQEAQQTRQEDLARMRLELAGMGVGQANQRAAMKMYQAGATPSKPGTPAETPAETPSSDVALRSMGIEDQGVQVAPAVPLIPKKQFIASQLLKGGNLPDAEIAYDKYLRDDIKIAQNGMLYQGSTGRLFDMPDPTPVLVPFLSLKGEPFQITKTQARKLDQITASGDNNARIAYENKLRGIQAPKPAAPPLPAAPLTEGVTTSPIAPQKITASPPQLASPPPAPPAVARPSVAPGVPQSGPGMQSPADIERKKLEDANVREIEKARLIAINAAKIAAEQGAEAKFEEGVGSGRAKLAIDEESRITQSAQNAGKLFTAADTVVNAVKKSPDYFGVFNKPGIVNAIGATVAEAAKPGGRFTIIDVEQKVLQSMPGTTKENLLDREKAASALAEIELGYTQTYLAKQGAVTEGERKIVRAIPGGLSSSPKFLEIKSKLIRERAQYDMDVNLAYSEYMRSKPNGNAIDFTRNSPLYKEIHNKFERSTAELANTIPAIPRQSRQEQKPPSNPAVDYAEALRKRMQQ